MNPEVSVIIPAYNSQDFIGAALDSVLDQCLQPDEVIVVDDGSTDRTEEIVLGYQRSHHDLLKYIRQPNKGPAAARNRGIESARGKWIALLDHDDFWEPDHLMQMLKIAQENEQAALVYSGKKWVDMRGQPIPGLSHQSCFPSGWIFNDLVVSNYISSCSTVLVRRSIIQELGGFDETIWIVDDWDMWLRIAAAAVICGVPSYTVNYRRHDSNLTLKTIDRLKGLLTIPQRANCLIKEKKVDPRNHPERLNVREIMRRRYKEAAIGMFYLGGYKELRSLGMDALKRWCVSPELLVRWVLSCLPKGMLEGVKHVTQSVKRYRRPKIGR